MKPPAVHATLRYAVRDVSIAGAVIPAGAQVLVFGAAHLAFGHGIHHCLVA